MAFKNIAWWKLNMSTTLDICYSDMLRGLVLP